MTGGMISGLFYGWVAGWLLAGVVGFSYHDWKFSLLFGWRLRVWREKPRRELPDWGSHRFEEWFAELREARERAGLVLPEGWTTAPRTAEGKDALVAELRAERQKREDEELALRIVPIIRKQMLGDVAVIIKAHLDGLDKRLGIISDAAKQAGGGSDGIVSDEPPGQFPATVHAPIEEPGQQEQPAVPTIALNDINAQIEATHAELQALPKGPDSAEEIVALQNRLRTLYGMRDRGR